MKKPYVLQILLPHEIIIWISSVFVIIIAYLFSGQNLLNMVTSLIGVTALIYLAKGEPLGQILSVLFSVTYAIVALTFRYYGEMLTYLLMTLPSSVFATMIWLKNPHQKGVSQVKVAKITPAKILLIALLTPFVTIAFYFLLDYFHTPNLIISTISITTSFIASMLTFFRTRYYAIAYAFNDIILITLWTLATITNLTYLPMVICFIVFLVNDLYAFFNWKKLEKAQAISYDKSRNEAL